MNVNYGSYAGACARPKLGAKETGVLADCHWGDRGEFNHRERRDHIDGRGTGRKAWAARDAGVFAQGQHGEREWQAEARWMGLALWASKAQCCLAPHPLLHQKRGGGCWRTGVSTRGTIGEDLERWMRITRLEVAWAFGWAGVMDLMDLVDVRDQKDQRLCLAKGTKGHEKTREGTNRHGKAQNFGCVCFLAGRTGRSSISAPLAKVGWREGDESRLVPLNPSSGRQDECSCDLLAGWVAFRNGAVIWRGGIGGGGLAGRTPSNMAAPGAALV
ncbi:MAG: hypothetical protein JWR26_2925 [Pedosphaera sp.]|nr:hypothetical protein [Pedosphaera sp.]